MIHLCYSLNSRFSIDLIYNNKYMDEEVKVEGEVVAEEVVAEEEAATEAPVAEEETTA